MIRPLLTLLAPALLAPALLAGPALAADPLVDKCETRAELTRLDVALPRVADRLARGKPLRIVTIGSSSTAGAGASEPARNYPSVLAATLGTRLQGLSIKVVNAGVNGDMTKSMVARFDRDVFPHRPHLVIWQVGANAVLRENGVEAHEPVIQDGVRRLLASGADVVLMDVQYAPRILRDPDHQDMEAMLARIAAEEGVGLFRRFDIMRWWIETGRMSNEEMLSPDGLHLNDLSYGCIGRLIAHSILDATERAIAGR